MDIISRLDSETFFKLSSAFKRQEKELGEGLPLLDFVELMLSYLPQPRNMREKKELLSSLITLFEEIDVNGDGMLEFDELISHCVDAGMALTSTKNIPFKHFYKESKTYEDKATIGDHISRLRWIEPLKRLFVMESHSKLVRVYDNEMHLVADIDTSVKSLEASLAKRDQQSVTANLSSSEQSMEMHRIAMEFIVLDVEYIPSLGQIVTSTSDFALTFWNAENFKFIGEMRSTTAQSLIRWCPSSSSLLTTGTDGVIFVWEVTATTKKQRRILVLHTDVVMDILECSKHDMVVTIGLDHRLYLWDMIDFRPRGQLSGHTRGIRCVTFSSSCDTLFTAGFEYEIFVWDLGSRRLVTKLCAHRSPIVDLKIVNFKNDHLITADEDGVFKVWNIQRSHSASFKVVESFTWRSTMSRIHLRNFAIVEPSHNIVAGTCRMHLFKLQHMKEDNSMPLFSFYNKFSNQFVNVTTSRITVTDGSSGETIEERNRIHESDITYCCRDLLGKKIILATESGAVSVYNCANFAKIRENTNPISSTISIMYAGPEKIAIVATSDGSIHVFADDTGPELSEIRTLEASHKYSVVDSVFSRNLSLIATASSDLSIKIWDFVSLNLIATCSGSRTELQRLEFIDQLPLLASSDDRGNIFFWATRPHVRNGTCVHAMKHQSVADDEVQAFITSKTCHTSVVSVMKSILDNSDRHLLFTGDEHGSIRCWDLSPMVRRLGIKKLVDKDLIWKQQGYSPYQKVHRVEEKTPLEDIAQIPADIPTNRMSYSADAIRQSQSRRLYMGVTTTASDDSGFSCWKPSDILLVATWNAHSDCVTQLEVMQQPNIIISASYDYTVNIWDWKGNLLGPENFRDQKVCQVIQELRHQQGDPAAVVQRNDDSENIKSHRLLKHTLIKSGRQNHERPKSVSNHLKPIKSSKKLARKSSLIQLEKRNSEPLLQEITPMDLLSDLCTFGDKQQEENSSIQLILRSSSSGLSGPSVREKNSLFNKYIKAYANYSTLIDERRERIESFKSKSIDISPSEFLRSKLEFNKDGRVVGSAIPKSKTTEPSKFIKKYPVTTKPVRAVSLMQKSASDGTLYRSKSPSKSQQRKLTSIDGIISSIDTKSGKAIQKKPTLERIKETQRRFTVKIDSLDTEEVKPVPGPASTSKAQLKKLKEKKMKNYLKQKQKQVNSSLGGALRKSSMLYYSRDSDKKVATEKQFGVYSTKEIMSVIRLFWSLDYDMSGSVECEELVGSDMFSCMGFGDPSSLFQTLDLDGSGDVSLDELLTVCFPYASARDIQEMVQLGQVGRLRNDNGAEQELTNAQQDELREIFKIFDKDNSGGVSADEIIQVFAGRDGTMGYGFSVEEIVNFCKEYDVDGNNELDENEFISLMKALYGNLK